MAFVVLVGAGLAAGAWLLARVKVLGALDADPPDDAASVSVIVPARDEASTIPRLLRSLALLDVAPLEVIVVDDGSTDDTASISESLGARVVRVEGPPPGWFGKPWACHVGRSEAAGTHLLFLDADTWLAPHALGALVAVHASYGGLISVQPYHQTQRWYEECSAYPNLVSMMGTGAFALRSLRPRGAFGPCLITTARDYDAVGGHASVRAEVAEDVHLALRYRASGRAVRCFAGRDAVTFRMYPGGSRQLVEGWSKNLAAGVVGADRVAVAGAVLWVCAHAAVAVQVPLDFGRFAFGASGFPWLVAAAWLLVAVQLRVMLHRIGSFRNTTAILFPIPLAVFMAVFVRSLVLTFVFRRVRWRGRSLGLRASRR